MSEFIKIGQIINTHGHTGELKIYPLTDDPHRFYDLQQVYIAKTLYTIKDVRLHQNFVLLSLQEIADMNAAEELKNLYVEIPRHEVKPLPEGSFYLFELVGLAVYEDEKLLGTLTNVLQTGSNDVYVVKTPEEKEIYLPALKSVVKEVDLKAGRINVIIPPGLLD
jgi:16S rRNA processing protein RimM